MSWECWLCCHHVVELFGCFDKSLKIWSSKLAHDLAAHFTSIVPIVVLVGCNHITIVLIIHFHACILVSTRNTDRNCYLVQLAFCFVVYPCLVLQYMGRAAFLSRNFSAPMNFYASIPGKPLWPLRYSLCYKTCFSFTFTIFMVMYEAFWSCLVLLVFNSFLLNTIL